jgi:hypothetical protein
VYGIFTALIVVAAQADEQELVPFYAVSVFLSFLAGLIAMVVFFYREGKRGALMVAFVLVITSPGCSPWPPWARPSSSQAASTGYG